MIVEIKFHGIIRCNADEGDEFESNQLSAGKIKEYLEGGIKAECLLEEDTVSIEVESIRMECEGE